MNGHKRFLYLVARIAAFGLMAFVVIFVMREMFVRNFAPEPVAQEEGPNPISGFVNCINTNRPPANPTGERDPSPLNNIRVVHQSSDFGIISGGRDVEGRWYAIVDFRHDPPRVFDARALADSPERVLRRSIASFQVTEAFRACDASYAGLAPAQPEEWSAWFGDPFFDRYRP